MIKTILETKRLLLFLTVIFLSSLHATKHATQTKDFYDAQENQSTELFYDAREENTEIYINILVTQEPEDSYESIYSVYYNNIKNKNEEIIKTMENLDEVDNILEEIFSNYESANFTCKITLQKTEEQEEENLSETLFYKRKDSFSGRIKTYKNKNEWYKTLSQDHGKIWYIEDIHDKNEICS